MNWTTQDIPPQQGRQAAVSRRARDEAAAARLWELSVRATGARWPGEAP